LKLKCGHSPLNLRILSSTSDPFTLTTAQVPNLALTHRKRITVRVNIEVKKQVIIKGTVARYFLLWAVILRERGLASTEQEFPETVRLHDFLEGLSLQNLFCILGVPESQKILTKQLFW
jgi:hypothetical protein